MHEYGQLGIGNFPEPCRVPVSEGVDDQLEAYLCGPPPMIDAALPLLESAGVPPEQVFYDKFTISAAADN